MPDPVVFLSHFRIREGQLGHVRQMADAATSELEAEKPRTVLFQFYLGADGGSISFLHAFPDAESMDLHFDGADERSRAASLYMDPIGWEVYGTPSTVALESLIQAADSAGVPLAQHPEYLGGFLRLKAV